jgi:hypothetical protein
MLVRRCFERRDCTNSERSISLGKEELKGGITPVKITSGALNMDFSMGGTNSVATSSAVTNEAKKSDSPAATWEGTTDFELIISLT